VPLIYTNTTYTIIFGSVFGIWATSELTGPVRWSQSRQGRKRDRGSILIGTALGLLGVVLALWFPLLLPNVSMGQPVAFFVGIALVFVGIYWRWYAIRTLGRFFTATVIIQENQHIITHGPYRLIRHPSYSGVLVIIAGLGCMIGNWISLLFILSGLFIPLLYRIAVEEQELLHAFGEQYETYMQRTKRLIPFVF
jgi:protein-S-isoprenylcysteine O-methyltransferase